ncbi:MAG TPA: peptide chain release factor N(5)-glutamine methyltransferase [Clostridiales bacterium]|nr:peptide chain release factor N(5)-glutamine methyltransferase [Clostridiales bacterium]
MVISELLTEMSQKLKECGIENSYFEAKCILEFTLNIKPSELILNAKNEVLKKDEDRALNLLKRRISGEPLQYILGTQEFMSLPFFVTKDTLIPRQDTETLVEFLLSETEDLPLLLLDIGTGTGCIPISLAHFKKKFRCLGIDISEKALSLAKKNADNLGVSERVNFEILDILSQIPNAKYDVIVSNPPYIKSTDIDTLEPEVRLYEPHLALDGGADGLTFYRRICDIAPKILKNGGLLAFEIGFDQKDNVYSLMKNDFKDIKVIKDLCGNNRVVAGYLK